MAVNMSVEVYLPNQNVFGRPVTFTSKTGASFSGIARGIYSSQDQNIMLEDGSILTDQETILDIRADEFLSLPVQDDTVDIPVDPISGTDYGVGSYQIINTWHNGGGEVTLQLRRIETA